MPDDNLTTRITRVEEKVSSLQIRRQEQDERWRDMQSRLERIDQRLSKQQGFWAGVTFLAAALGAVIKVGWDKLFSVQ